MRIPTETVEESEYTGTSELKSDQDSKSTYVSSNSNPDKKMITQEKKPNVMEDEVTLKTESFTFTKTIIEDLKSNDCKDTSDCTFEDLLTLENITENIEDIEVCQKITSSSEDRDTIERRGTCENCIECLAKQRVTEILKNSQHCKLARVEYHTEFDDLGEYCVLEGFYNDTDHTNTIVTTAKFEEDPMLVDLTNDEKAAWKETMLKKFCNDEEYVEISNKIDESQNAINGFGGIGSG